VPFEARRGSVGYDHVYSAEFVIQLGFVKAFPLFVEHWVEHNFFFALKNLVVDLLSLKQLFTIFTERTRDAFYTQGVLFGSASYIATARTFATLSSNFVHLYHLYAPSHFYFGLKIAALAVLYGMVTDLPGYYALSTWGLWVLVGANWLSPWLFNPHSFRFFQVQSNFVEFLRWLDDAPGVRPGMGSWHTWHEHTNELARKQPWRKRLTLLVWRQGWLLVLVVFCLAGLEEKKLEEVDNSGGDDPRSPFSRTLVLLTNGAFFHLVALVYYHLVGPQVHLVHVLLPHSKLGAFALSWALRLSFSSGPPPDLLLALLGQLPPARFDIGPRTALIKQRYAHPRLRTSSNIAVLFAES
jgi:hypothetical protein